MSLLSGAYAGGSKRSHIDMCNLSWTPQLLDKKENVETKPVNNSQNYECSQLLQTEAVSLGYDRLYFLPREIK